MSFKVYEYECSECKTIDKLFVRNEEKDSQHCDCGQVLTRLMCAPHLDYMGMGNDPDMHTAWEKKGDMIAARHRAAGQHHRPK